MHTQKRTGIARPFLVKFFEIIDLSSDFVVLSDLLEDSVSSFAGLLYVAGLQRKAKSFGSRIWLVNSEVAPPYTAVVPEMMIGIVVVDAERELGFAFHTVLSFLPISRGRILSDS